MFLKIEKLKEYFDKRKLGRITLPTVHDWPNVNLFSELNSVYRFITEWNPNEGETLKFENIVAIIVIGSSVMTQHRKRSKLIRKYVFFGSRIEVFEEYFHIPHDVDFLIITKENYKNDEKILKPIYRNYYDGFELKKAGLHAVYRSLEQFKNGLGNGDTVSDSALKHGVVIASSEEFVRKYGWDTKCSIDWTEDDLNNLNCQINF